ncbi:hypothetical protein HDV05_002361 [Chytridiales sp. JEL 0842]|nr:hypothetical protein HDV05_002361 [Chytridiales sp. JEL 0842]
MSRLTDLLNRLKLSNEPPQVRLEYMNNLLKQLRSMRDSDMLAVLHPVILTLRGCLNDSTKEIRANAFRILRHMVIGEHVVKEMMSASLDLHLVRAMTRERHDLEREQGLKLFRAFIDCPDGSAHIPQSVVRVIVAIAEHVEDKFRSVCIETLCELAIKNTELVALCGGLKILFAALIEGPRELMDILVMTIIYILDNEETRVYIRPSVELEILVSNFTDAYSKGPAHEEKLRACSLAVARLIYMTINRRLAVKSIVESLQLPQEEIRKIVLNMLFDIFQIDLPKWFPEYLSAKDKNAFASKFIEEEGPRQNASIRSLSNVTSQTNLITHYLCLLVIIFVEAGLLEALINLLQDSNKEVSTKATILISEILEMCKDFLPESYFPRIQTLPSLFSFASDFSDELKRHNATLAFYQIDTLLQQKHKLAVHRIEDSSVSRPEQQLSRQIESIKFMMGVTIDDGHLKTLINEAEKITVIKDYTKWNWDAITELLQGPLLVPKRLDEVLKNNKFVKRLLNFYRPLSHQYADIKKNKSTSKLTQIACELLTTLISSAEGVRYLAESKLLPEIIECFGQLDPIQVTPGTEPIFSRARMESLLTGDYFVLLATLSKYENGVKLLERFKVYNYLYHLTELRGRDDLIKAMISSLDYSKEGHERVLLSKIMTSSPKNVRLLSTCLMLNISRAAYADFDEWGIELLVTQLYDPALEVRERAVLVLEEASRNQRNLESLIRYSPFIDQLGDAGNALYLRFLSTSIGFKFLEVSSSIKDEMTYWLEFGIFNYVSRVELCLGYASAGTFAKPREQKPFESAESSSKDSDDTESFDVLPTHFYGELVRTAEGCTVLEESGHFQVFDDYVSRYNVGMPSTKSTLKLKSYLWAIGHVGSCKNGLKFLVESNSIPKILKIAEMTKILSLKGTCFYVLGLMSRNSWGADILESLGWESVVDRRGSFHGLCVPLNLDSFLSVAPWEFKGSWPDHNYNLNTDGLEPIEEEILKNIGNMSNHILANGASKTLSRLRYENPEVFLRTSLYLRVADMLGSFHYRLSARRFIHELFDKIVLDLK